MTPQTRRKCGILLHPTSLPGPGGIGSLGEEARSFVRFLEAAGQSLWQILPLGPTAYGNSPYSAYSAFAGNPLVIDLDAIAAEGDIGAADLVDDSVEDWVDFPRVQQHRAALLRRGAARFFASGEHPRMEEFWRFCDENNWWLHDFALFMAFKEHFGGKSWNRWPEGVARRDTRAMAQFGELLGARVGEEKYVQWQFRRQWKGLKAYANDRGVGIVGDMPIFVAYDSADVWANQGLFHLDATGKPTVVAGVPPDYFSKTGQLWGNPLYNWRKVADTGYSWWIARLRNDLDLYDMVRIDHFRGFEAYWEVQAGERTAVNGRWVEGPGDALFTTLHNALGTLPLIAEDLGVITPAVEALRDRYGLPGMKILQFAFDSGADNTYLPHNHVPNSVVYTGTHDNDTTTGWLASLSQRDRKRVQTYLHTDGHDLVWDLIRAAVASVASIAIIPLQDLLALPSDARMNTPGTPHGNWEWRCRHAHLAQAAAERLRALVELYGRCAVRPE